MKSTGQGEPVSHDLQRLAWCHHQSSGEMVAEKQGKDGDEGPEEGSRQAAQPMEPEA